MNKKLILSIGAVIGVLLLGLVIYQSDASHASPKLSNTDIEQLVTSQYPGTITELELEKDGNKAVYEVEVMSDGKEYDLKLDGDSGEVLQLKEKVVKIEGEKIDKDHTNVNDDHGDDDNDARQTVENSKENNEQVQPEAPTKENQSKENNKSNNENHHKHHKHHKGNETHHKGHHGKRGAVISIDQAVEIALNEFSGTVEDVELDEDDGRLIYEIEIESGREEAEIEIDAYTGEIISIEIDRD